MKSFLVLILFLLSVPLSTPADAHGGEDHEHAAPATLTQDAPRATAQTEDFELVAVLQSRSLIIYLDRFADNELVAGAQIEVESGSVLKASAKQTAPGVYVVELPKGVFEKAGKYPLSISIQAGELGDVMTASLEIPDLAEEAHTHADEVTSWKWPALGAGLVLLALLTFAFARQRRAAGEFK